MTREELLIEFLPEIVFGSAGTMFAFLFRNWTASITVQIERILHRVNLLTVEFHDYRVEQEGRMSRAETDLKNIYRRLDHEDVKRAVLSQRGQPEEH
jgi:hypothetical protein